jgi:DNA-binding transcriptional LysR family regulator
VALNLDDVRVFAAVARAGGFREASRTSGTSASSASEAVRRLEAELGVRLLHRTTRSVAPTEAGAGLLDRLAPALAEIGAALDVVKSSRDQPAGTLRLNVPVVAARLVLPRILPPFLAAYPGIRVEVTADNKLVDILAAGCDDGIRYEETLEKDMVAVPIGQREQCLALAPSPAYLERRGRPTHPRQLLDHACLRGRFTNGALCATRPRRAISVPAPGARLLVHVGRRWGRQCHAVREQHESDAGTIPREVLRVDERHLLEGAT